MKPTTVAKYMATLKPPARTALQSVRKAVLAAIPDGEEVISYSMPGVRVGGRVAIWFAAWREHVALYPMYRALPKFEKKLAKYEKTKGALKFPLDEKLPLKLISDVAKYFASETRATSRKK